MPANFRVSPFSVDVTIPLGHRCMGLLPTKSKEVIDPLQAHGFVLQTGDAPIVQVAVDWCEIRNEAYERWREVIAKSVGTTKEKVLLSCLHQHDAPVTDIGAQNLLDREGLVGELFDFAFHEQCVQKVAAAAKASMANAQPVTHLGTGQAKVEMLASNRRVVRANGAVSFDRGSRSAQDAFMAAAPVGEIDPFLKTLSFWNGDKAMLALHAYATHPMSYYGGGGVTYDFVGMARERRRADDPSIQQIYVSGCSGDVTAGKYNNGSKDSRPLLADRLYQAMKTAWQETKRVPLDQANVRVGKLELPFRAEERFSSGALLAQIEDTKLTTEKRIYAAMSLSSRRRVLEHHPIDLPVIDFGAAQLVLFPGEAFVGYQLMAQQMRPDRFVVSIGYGECWPGYIPMAASFADKFEDSWLWVPAGCEERIRAVLAKVMK